MYSSFALFSLEKTTSKDIFTMKAASDIETTLKIFEYKKITVSAGDNTSVMVNVNNDTGGSIYYGVFYEMVSPNVKTDDIGIYKIDWSANATSGSITNGSKLPVELIIINNSSSDITLNIGVAGSDSNELGLSDGKILITETFNTGTEPSGDEGTTKTTTTNYSYTGAVQTATLKAGTHKLEVWGAQGGSYNTSYYGGKGGYSYGTLTLTENITAYINIGGQGGSVSSSTTGGTGGNNGGGAGGNGSSSSTGIAGSGGGGATDIRLKQDSLYARVIVAGGGGGAGGAGQNGGSSLDNNTASIGGIGGGTSGITGNNSGQSNYGGKAGGAGTATTAGTAGSASTSTTSSTDNTYCAGGGGGAGGGWYGGGGGGGGSLTQSSQRGNAGNSGSFGTGGKGGASYSSCERAYYGSGGGSGGGGSGYVYTSSTATNYPSGCLLNSSYYLTNASTIGGNTSFTDSSGSTVTGHSGNGYARITSTVKASTVPSIDTSSVTLKPNPVTNLKDIVTCSDNGSGCKIVLVKPSNTSKLEEDVTNKVLYVLEDNSGKRYKYNKNVVITNALRGNAANAVKDSDDGTTGDSGSGVYKVTHSAITASSSATGSEIPAVTDYRYYGASPNNYICLDMEGSSTCPDKHLYRIIGSIYEEKENTNRIKVIKATPLTDGTTKGFSWDYTSSKIYNNIWATITSGNYSNSLTSGSQLMKLLNSGAWWNGTSGSYYNNSTTATTVNFTNYKLSDKVKSYITTSRYYLGGYYKSHGVMTNQFYTYERGTARYDTNISLYWDGYVGLMYPSDYGYAAGNSCVTGTDPYNYDGGCKNKDWLWMTTSSDYFNGGEWLMSPISGNSDSVFLVNSSGLVDYSQLSRYVRSVRPTFYLKADTNIKSGDGSSTNPYILS